MRNSTGGVCCTKLASEKRKGHLPIIVFFFGGGGAIGLRVSKGELLRGILM